MSLTCRDAPDVHAHCYKCLVTACTDPPLPLELDARLTSSQHYLKVRGSGAPYKFRCVNSLLTYKVVQSDLIYIRTIESILLSVLSALEAEMVFIRNLVGGLLAELEDDINHDKFKRLPQYSRRLATFKNRATLV